MWLPVMWPPTEHLARNPVTCPDWDSNWQPFGSQPMLSLLSYTSQGCLQIFSNFPCDYFVPLVVLVCCLISTGSFTVNKNLESPYQGQKPVKLFIIQPWLVWLSGLKTGLQTERSPVLFLVRALAWVAGQVPSSGCTRGN